MKYSVLFVAGLSAVALAAPAPTLWGDKDCKYKKPVGHYSHDYKGCVAYNLDEIKYKAKCWHYEPKYKHCELDKDKDKVGFILFLPASCTITTRPSPSLEHLYRC
ncbi:hypothetical protein SVAN01_08335 [Stagonosporopsis vannaccii]|nr:hypothetical protein SVAN01_08335 [Stagonosporopsis vannaccii]